MPKVLQFRRASTATIAATLGALGEVFYNTDTKTLATFDGTTTGGTALATAASVSSTSSILSTIINNQSSTLVGYINAQDSSISSTLTVNYTAADSSQSSILTTNYKAADSSLNATINFVSSTLYSVIATLSSNTWRAATTSILGLAKYTDSSVLVTSGVVSVNPVQTSSFYFTTSINVGVSSLASTALINLLNSNPQILYYDTDAVISDTRPAWLVGANGVQFYIATNSSYSVTAGSAQKLGMNASGLTTLYVHGNAAGLVPGMQLYRLNSDYVGSDISTAQKLFGVGVNLAANTVYEFELYYTLGKTAGGNAHTVSIGFGGTATVNNIGYNYFVGAASNSNLLNALSAADGDAWITTASPVVLTVSNNQATRYWICSIKGTVSINTGGTFIPEYTLSAAPGGAYSTINGSYMQIYPIGPAGANTRIGSWS